MNSILFILSIIIAALIGFAAVSIAEGKKQIFSLLDKAALSFPLGAGIIAFYLFYISILGLDISITSATPLFILSSFSILKLYQVGTGLYPYINYDECWRDQSRIKRLLLIIFTVTIVWKLSMMFFNAIVIPPFFDDAISCWSYKAKVIYLNKSIEMNPDNPLFLGGAYNHYPLGASLFRVWIALIMGGWHESYIQLHSFFILISLIMFIFMSLREYTSFFTRVLSSYLIVSIPLMTTHAYAGYADIIISCYITISLILLLKWYFIKERNILIVAAVSLASAIFTKNEGLVLYLPSALIILSYYCYKSNIKLDEKIQAVSIFLITLCLVGGPWIAFKVVYNIPLW